MGNITYYIALLLLIIMGFFIVRKVAGCIVRTIVLVVLMAVFGVLYWLYFR